MKVPLLVVCLAFLAVGCADHVTVRPGQFAWVSLIRLVANPGEYDGEGVQVEGYFIHNRSGISNEGYLYLDEASFTHELDKNALAVKIPNDLVDAADELNGQYVVLRGTFDRKYLGPWSLYAGGVRLHELWAKVIHNEPPTSNPEPAPSPASSVPPLAADHRAPPRAQWVHDEGAR